MIKKDLKRDYDAITPEERAALFIRAMAREDQVEADRLCNSAPGTRSIVMHHTAHVKGFCLLAMEYEINQLRQAVYDLLFHQWANGEPCDDDSSPEQRSYLWARLVTAWNYCQEKEAFETFCASNGFDAASLLKAGETDALVIADRAIASRELTSDSMARLAETHQQDWPENPKTIDQRIEWYEKQYAKFVGGS